MVLGVVPVAVLCLVLALPLLLLPGSSGAAPPGAVEGIPARVLTAYRATDGWCPGLRWQLLAGIGSVESGHGASGGSSVDAATGEVAPPILGPPLDGSPGVLRLPIGRWLGWFGLPGPWQHAVGPMQFLPGTFAAWGTDADGDGLANPHDVDDAAASAGNYLCGGRNGEVADERAALLRYNDSGDYADRVLAYADQLGSGAGVQLVCPVAGPVTFTNTWGAPRSGGRQHKGVDLFAADGTPVVAPASGEVELRSDALGGLAFHLWGDDGNYYYGAHLAGFANVSSQIAAGTVLGSVGSTGNALGTGAHLHFEVHLERSRGDPPNAVDPTDIISGICSRERSVSDHR